DVRIRVVAGGRERDLLHFPHMHLAGLQARMARHRARQEAERNQPYHLDFEHVRRVPRSRASANMRALMEAIVAVLSDAQVGIAFFTLTPLELVLGIDNIIFISILVDRLDRVRREKARRIGLFLAMFMRIALLMALSWIVGLTAPLFVII